MKHTRGIHDNWTAAATQEGRGEGGNGRSATVRKMRRRPHGDAWPVPMVPDLVVPSNFKVCTVVWCAAISSGQ